MMTDDEMMDRIDELESAIDIEQVHNDDLHQRNINLKNQIRSLETKLKVVVLPVTVQYLVSQVNQQDKTIEILSGAFLELLSMVEITEANKNAVDRIRRTYQELG